MKQRLKPLILTGALFSTLVTAQTIELYKSPTCGCCEKWAAIMQEKGYSVNVHHPQSLVAIKQEHGLPMQLQSCHSAFIDGYLIEGHVPEADITKLLDARPQNTNAIAVPGMPQAAPGMARQGQAYRNFKVIAFDQTGKLSLYNQY
jgi:hypothetical protein